ncbi:MAG: cytochrome c-type biogenesis CcmF C-terminal domain-containing protein [Gemmatimonadaceae bacterium]
MTVVGELALWVALFLSVFGSATSFAGRAMRRSELVASAVRAVYAAAAMTGLASIGLWTALLGHDFSLDYVASHTTTNTPTLYLLTAFWGGTGGAILSFALALSLCGALAVSGARRRNDESLPWLAGGLAGELAFVLALIGFAINPYDRVEWVPAEGRGLSAHLQNPLAAPYFAAIYSAYAAAAVALTLAIAAMPARRADVASLGTLRRWALVAWCLLTIGIALRMRWAYVEPALGGLWSWGPGEWANAVLWLVGATVVRSSAIRLAGARAPGAVERRRRIVGMYLVYAGVAVVLFGAAGRRWWTDRRIRLQPGQAAELVDPYGRRWRFVSQGISRDERINYLSTGVALEAWRPDGNAGIVSAERRQYLDSVQRATGEPATKPGIRSFLDLDLYVLLAGLRGETAELRVGFRPLVALVWIGCLLVLLGVLAVVAQSIHRGGVRNDLRAAAAG